MMPKTIQTMAWAYQQICTGEDPWTALGNFTNAWYDYAKDIRLMDEQVLFQRCTCLVAFKLARAIIALRTLREHFHGSFAGLEGLTLPVCYCIGGFG